MSSTGGRSSEPFPWEFASPRASVGRPFAVGDRRVQRSRRASARRERDLVRVRDPSLEESAVAYLAAGVQTTSGGSTQGWIWWQDFMRSLGESPEQHAELADGPEVRLRIEGYYLRFVVWLVHVRRVQVETARKYFGEALSAHTSFYGPPVPGYNMPRVRKMIKGMAKVIDAPPGVLGGRCVPRTLRWLSKGFLSTPCRRLTPGHVPRWDFAACSGRRRCRFSVGRSGRRRAPLVAPMLASWYALEMGDRQSGSRSMRSSVGRNTLWSPPR